MNKKSIERRNFIKMMGLSGITAANNISAKNYSSLNKPIDKNNFIIEKLSTNYYKADKSILKSMDEKNTVFSRNFWDPTRQKRPRENITYENLIKGKGQIPNQTRLDYALNAGSWFIAHNTGKITYDWNDRNQHSKTDEYWNPESIGMNWKDTSKAVKHAAHFYGASLVGIAEINPLWLYSSNYSPTKKKREHTIPVLHSGDRLERTDTARYIPKSMNRVIALAFEEDFKAISNSPGRLASAATGNGYSRMAFTAGCLAKFIRFLGYKAIPAGNGVGLSIPIAIDAGLGELGRMGLLVTPKYGPRVRIAKIITDMPLLPDSPIRFGVTEFCQACKLCAEHCPSDSISHGPPTWKGESPSNSNGIYKWYIHPESCYDYNGFSCSNCKRVCPFSKPNNSWLHRMIRKIIESKNIPLNNIMVSLDQASGYGDQISDKKFWETKISDML